MNIKKKLVFNSIDDIFQWKLKNGESLSVEDDNREKSQRLNWGDNIDVLYSFLLIYKLGLEVINNERFSELKEEYKQNHKIIRLNPMSLKFLYYCSQDSTFKSLNENKDMLKFLSLYSSIGNVIPIWPGGNEARGKKGIYDIPEIFFNMYPLWTDELIRQHQDSIFLDEVVKNDCFKISREHGKSSITYKNMFSSIEVLKDIMKNNSQAYYDYLKHRNKVISSRSEKIDNYIKSTL